MINILKKSREVEINSLVTEGYITAAVAGKLKDDFLTVKSEFITENGDITDNFDNVVNALRKNDKVISYGGKTGLQLPTNTKTEKSLLVQEMEKRAASFAK